MAQATRAAFSSAALFLIAFLAAHSDSLALPTTTPSRISEPAVDCPPCLEDRFLEHYRQKGCRAVFTDECGDKCPVRYECPSEVKANFKQDECQFLGNTYSMGQDVKTANPCEICSCSPNYDDESGGDFANRTEKAAINCAYVECPEQFGVPPYPLEADSDALDNGTFKNCYYAHELDSCCSTHRKCPSDEEVASTPVCAYGGRNYRLGEKIYPEEDNCQVCLCTNDWDPAAPTKGTCRKVACSTSPTDAARLGRGCVPIYHEGTCCAIDYHCPKPKKNVEQRKEICSQAVDRGLCYAAFKRFHFNSQSKRCEQFSFGGCGGNDNNFETSDECEEFCLDAKKDDGAQEVANENKCIFDGKSYALGAVLRSESVCVDCRCRLPPDFTCVQKSCPSPKDEQCVSHFKVGECCPTYDCTKKDECVVALEHYQCQGASQNCTKYFDAKGCAACLCDDTSLESCPTPLCAENCRLAVEIEGACPSCVCDESSTQFFAMETANETTESSNVYETTTRDASLEPSDEIAGLQL